MFTMLTGTAEAASNSNLLEWVKIIPAGLTGALLGWFSSYITEKIRRKSIVRKYREFIGYSAWALQERIWSIILNKESRLADYFVEYKVRETRRNPEGREFADVYAANALNYTVFLFCQFFAWREIINREMYNFRVRRRGLDSQVLRKLIDIEHWFSTSTDLNLKSKEEDKYIKNFLILRGEQRALGDMCVRFNEHTKVYECISFSEFVEKWSHLGSETRFSCYFSVKTLENDVRAMLNDKGKKPFGFDNKEYRRLILVRDSLLDLLDILDPLDYLSCPPRYLRHPDTRKHDPKAVGFKQKTPAKERESLWQCLRKFICDKFSCNRK